jgi:hypothetical protein
MKTTPFYVALGSVLLTPVVFFGIMFAWEQVDAFLGARELSHFIHDHQSLVTKRLTDPKVHSFSLTHDPAQRGSVLIQFDVDDRATYEMLESDLDDIWGLRYPPAWKTVLRSQEKLSKNYGYAAFGFRELFEGVYRMMIAGIVSLAQAGVFVLHAARQAGKGVTSRS